MAKGKKPKRVFKPQSHAAVYAVAIIYLGYLLIRMIGDAIAGGADAPGPLHLVLGVVVLGGGIGLLGFMIWRMTHLEPAAGEGEAEASSNQADGNAEERESGEN